MTPRLYLGIDPGPTVSGICLYHPVSMSPICAEVMETESVLSLLRLGNWHQHEIKDCAVIIEDIVSYGKTGASTIETAMKIGAMMEACPGPVRRLSRPNVLGILCDNRTAKEAQAWARLCQVHGCTPETAKSRKGFQGRLPGVSSHARSALALCVVAAAQDDPDSPLGRLVILPGTKRA